MYQLMYISRANRLMAPDELGKLEASARANNARDDLSGLLVAWNGCFLQLLEGPADRVESTYERIRHDPRHDDLRVLTTGLIPRRRFERWSMQIVSLNDPATPLRGLLARHPPLSLSLDHYQDPMLAFTLLYDAQHALLGEARSAA